MSDKKKLLFLRGQVPQDRNPKQIMFNNLIDCDDMWTQLAYHLSKDSYGEIWYWGGKRKKEFTSNFIERWVRDFKSYKSDFKPDVIFARGGFSEYDVVLRRNPQAFKIYYGAGFRRIPKTSFKDFNLILVDTPEQFSRAQSKLPNKNIHIFTKPAADHIFCPREEDKKFDVILVGNYNKGVKKGHDFAFSRIPRNLKVLSVGLVPKTIRKKYPHVKYTGWVPRKKIPNYYAKSKISIVCCGTEDSCPRIVPESISCGCPVLILDRVNVWKEKYITNETGKITTKKLFVSDLLSMIEKYKDFSPYSYYQNYLSLSISAKDIIEKINELS